MYLLLYILYIIYITFVYTCVSMCIERGIYGKRRETSGMGSYKQMQGSLIQNSSEEPEKERNKIG